ncbi:MAG TPA: SRPBCC family protein [Solirubrobacteraceae bacterium]|nr:SRPBCC family protein [Solirubrobacteraceae bacterium]
MSRAERTRRLSSTPAAVWEVIGDPFQMPRWWPGVTRVEGVDDEAFTLVFQTKRRRPVRMDFRVLVSEPDAGRRAWEQEVRGTPFERVLDQSVIEVLLAPSDDGGTQVTISQVQKLRGFSRTGGIMLRRATDKRLREALERLELIVGG